MSPFQRWLKGWLRDDAPASLPRNLPTTEPDDPTGGLLAAARELARNGRLHDASHAFSKLSRRHGSPQIWLEHAELLLEIGDRFGAAAHATRVLELQPDNPRALSIRRAVLVEDHPSGQG